MNHRERLTLGHFRSNRQDIRKTDRRIDPVTFHRTPSAQRHDAEAKRLAVDTRDDTGAVRQHRLAHRSNRQMFAPSINESARSAQRRDHPAEPFRSGPDFDGMPHGLFPGLYIRSKPALRQQNSPESDGKFPQSALNAFGQNFHHLGDLQRIPEARRQWLVHVADDC